MRIRPLDPIGVDVTELRLTDVDAATGGAAAVVAGRPRCARPARAGQLDDAAFAPSCAPSAASPSPQARPRCRDSRISTWSATWDGRRRRAASSTSTPATCAARPRTPRCGPCASRRRGGATVFSDQYRAYETLPADVRERLRGRTISHVVTGLQLDDGRRGVGRASGLPPAPPLRAHRALPLDPRAMRRDQRAGTGARRRRRSASYRALHA